MILLVVFLLPILLLFYFNFQCTRTNRRTKTFGMGPLKTLSNLKNLANPIFNLSKDKYGFFHIWLGPNLFMFPADPESTQFLLKHPKIVKSDFFNSSIINSAFGRNVGGANKEVWKTYRSFINGAFTTDAHRTYFPTFERVVNKLLTIFDNKGTGDFDCLELLSRFAIDLLGESVFHYNFKNLDNTKNIYFDAYLNIVASGGPLTELLIILFPLVESLPSTLQPPGVKKLKASVDKLSELFLRMVDQHKQGVNHDDILAKLLVGMEQEHISTTELLSNIFVLFFAGHETTARALGWALAELAHRQDIQEKLYQEILNHYGTNPPTFDSISNPPAYLDHFIQEILRYHSPVNIIPSRIAEEDIPYKDQVIPKGTRIGLSIHSVHHHAGFWENPSSFNPERFSPESKKGRHKYAYMPFSVGPRQCIGNEFSLLEQRLVIVSVLCRYKVLPPKDHRPVNLNSHFPLGCCYDVFIRLERRI